MNAIIKIIQCETLLVRANTIINDMLDLTRGRARGVNQKLEGQSHL